jgi:glutathione peroxidase
MRMKLILNVAWVCLLGLNANAGTNAAPPPSTQASTSARIQTSSSDIYSIPLKSNDDKDTNLSIYKGKVLLIVNTASKCGYTPQYKSLEALYKKYQSQGLVVLGFPSNDFGHQEPGTNQQIRYFCQSKYHVDFPLFDKGPVGGDHIQPLFAWLLKHAPSSTPVAWNFEKFLISRDGKVLERFKSKVTPDSGELTGAIEKALAQK